MKRTIVFASLSLALTSAAIAQPPSAGVEWSQPVVGADGPSPQPVDIIEVISDLTGKPASAVTEDDLVWYWEQYQASYSGRVVPHLMAVEPVAIVTAEDLAANTPLPPPCEPPTPRSPAGPPAPKPEPCRP